MKVTELLNTSLAQATKPMPPTLRRANPTVPSMGKKAASTVAPPVATTVKQPLIDHETWMEQARARHNRFLNCSTMTESELRELDETLEQDPTEYDNRLRRHISSYWN
jgi:hypothetical protein